MTGRQVHQTPVDSTNTQPSTGQVLNNCNG